VAVILDAIPQRVFQVIPVLGFATLSRFDLAQRLLDSIDYPVEHLVIVDNSGKKQFEPRLNDNIRNLWMLQVPSGLGANGAWNLIIKSTPHAPYWVIPNDDSYFAPGALEIIANQVNTDGFNFVDVVPKWSCVIPTEGSVAKAGLWSERFHPIYFDDDEYEWRMKELGVSFHHIPATVMHDNSSTLHSGYQDVNNKTFNRNGLLLREKKAINDLSVWGWDLTVRRRNSWD